MGVPLTERLTFDTLYRLSEPRRKVRANTVSGPPLKLTTFADQTMWSFNFKSAPSTTGLRHHGYIRFIRPSSPRQLQKLECVVDCTCFSGETLVLMGDGVYKPIKDITVGDLVYTHTGSVKRVSNVLPRPVKEGENVWNVRVSGSIAPMTVTGNHPFYTLRGNDECLCGCGGVIPGRDNLPTPLKLTGVKYLTGHHRKPVSRVVEDKSSGRFEWVNVDDFRTKEWFLSPWLTHNTESDIDLDFARLAGYYAAEGCVPSTTVERYLEGVPLGNNSVVRLAFNIDETETLVADVQRICRALGYGCRVVPWRRDDSSPYTGVTVSVYSHYFAKFCHDHIGCGSRFKKFSPEVMGWSLDGLAQLYVGFQLGDGNVSDRLARCFSVNISLASQVSTILRKLHIQHGLRFDSTTEAWTVSVVAGDDLNEVLGLMGNLAPGGRVSEEISPQFKRSEGSLVSLTSRERNIDFNGLVYDITVEDDHSFIANGVAVHNCQDFKYRYAWAVKQRGSSTVGDRSMNQALNQAPRITNPTGRPGLCKHLLALKEYVYGVFSSLQPSDKQFTDDAMRKLITYGRNRWINMPAEIEQARERERRALAVRAARNRGQPEPTALSTEIEDPDEVNPQDAGSGSVPVPPSPPPRATNLTPRTPQNPAARPARPKPQADSVLMSVSKNTSKGLYESVRRDGGIALTECVEAKSLVEQCATTVGPTSPEGCADNSEAGEAIALLRQVADNTGQLAVLIRDLIGNDGEDSNLDLDLDDLAVPGGEDGSEDGDGSENGSPEEDGTEDKNFSPN